MIAVIDPANEPSIRTAESIGMRPTGERSLAHEGSLRWRITRDQWEPGP